MSHSLPLDDVTVSPHDPTWIAMYHNESKSILQALGSNVVASHHIGSTAIPKCFAKPIIDILIEVEDLFLVDSRNSMMVQNGYQIMGEYGIPDRRYFRKNNSAGNRLFHVHIFPKGNPNIDRHLAFRDFLIQNQYWAEKYSDLKRNLAENHRNSSRQYTEAKTELVKIIDQLASNWRCSNQAES